MANFTPGPWTTEDRGGLQGVDVLAIVQGWSEKPVRIAHVVPFESRNANANLIAAAPELLEALKNLVDACDGNYRELTQECEQIIAKAEGRQ